MGNIEVTCITFAFTASATNTILATATATSGATAGGVGITRCSSGEC
jgi:hypothetical protein